MPFVRLALARYQPESIPGAHLSTVVLADCVQLAPQRVAVVTFPEARSLRIMVSGMVGENALTVGASTGGGSSPQSPRPNLDLSRAILVTVERRVQSGRATVWAPVSDGLTNVMLKPWKEQSMMVAWAGDIALPSGFVRSGGIDSTYRLSIKEYELLEADTPADVLAMKIARQQVGAAAPPTGAADRLGGRPGVAGRIVYADIINL
jgi:hypothetical protein